MKEGCQTSKILPAGNELYSTANICYVSSKRKNDSKGSTVDTEAEDKDLDTEAQAKEAFSSPEGRSSHKE